MDESGSINYKELSCEERCQLEGHKGEEYMRCVQDCNNGIND